MIPWLINTMLCCLFFNKDLLRALAIQWANLKITVRSYFHKVVYPQTSVPVSASLAIFLLRMVTPAQIKYCADQKPRNICHRCLPIY